jgi:outer membrane protein OmpA-like peptidoglycan-associated protein
MKTKKSLPILILITLSSVIQLFGQVNTVSSDTDWSKQNSVLKNVPEAGFIIRIGDVDNLGFGWEEGFDPFCGKVANSHEWPWEPRIGDLPGFDRILLSSKFRAEAEHRCGSDGYASSPELALLKPVSFTLPTDVLKGATIKNAFLQLFIDDFQSPTFCSKFQIFLNSSRFAEAEKMFNAVDQTGPVGKLLTIPIPEEFFTMLTAGSQMVFKLDEITGAADGYAIDFIRLLVNRNLENTCKGNVSGVVLDKDSGEPVRAKVWRSDNYIKTTNAEGRFTFKNIPTGYEMINASADGYADGSVAADVYQGDESPEVTIFLKKGSGGVSFNNQPVMVGQTVTINNILFDAGKADLKPESVVELDKIATFLNENKIAEIELSGHTSSEGEAAFNRSLSYKRVTSCKNYVVSKGVDPGRIIAVGYGPDRPVAPNDTEAGRVKNRRVEMRVMKL